MENGLVRGLARLLGLVALSCAVAVGCDEDPIGDGGVADAAPADSGSSDAGAPPSCSFPEPMVAGTTETDALADSPARCGQPAHTWLRGPELGDVVEIADPVSYLPTVLGALVEGAGVTLPRAPEETVTVREYRYLTQDRGAMVETTATVAYPDSRDAGAELDVMLFLHGTSGFKDGCGPSNDETGLLAALFASFGYIVVVPDYLGLEWGEASYGELHPYLVGQATAIASIDAVRAGAGVAGQANDVVCARPRVVTFGGSQGGHAALWVERLMPYYARELEHLGVVTTVPPANLLGQVELALSDVISGSANIAAMYTTMPVWYGADDRLAEVFTPPFDTSLTAALEAECTPDPFDGVTAITDVYTATLVDASQRGELSMVDPWGCMAGENGLTTTSVPSVAGGRADNFGVLWVTGESDTLVDTALEREAYRTLCEAGLPLTYIECEGAGHTDATLWALPEILGFIDARAAGDAFTPGACAPAAPSMCMGTPTP